MVRAVRYSTVHPVSSLLRQQWNDLTRTSRALVREHEPDLRVYSTGDGPDVYEDEFMKIARPDGESFHSTLILVGTRLGIDKITSVYWEALISALQLPQSVGIAGYVIPKYSFTAPQANTRVQGADRPHPTTL